MAPRECAASNARYRARARAMPSAARAKRRCDRTRSRGPPFSALRARRSGGQRGDVDPPPFAPAALCQLDELHAFRALAQRPLAGRAFDDMADEQIPLALDAVVVGNRVGHELPTVVE